MALNHESLPPLINATHFIVLQTSLTAIDKSVAKVVIEIFRYRDFLSFCLTHVAADFETDHQNHIQFRSTAFSDSAADADREFDNEEEGENTFVCPTTKAANGMRLATVVVSEGTAEVGSNRSNRSSNSLLCPSLSPSFEELGHEKPDNTMMIFSGRQMTSIQVDQDIWSNCEPV